MNRVFGFQVKPCLVSYNILLIAFGSIILEVISANIFEVFLRFPKDVNLDIHIVLSCKYQ